jgi:hypothetical protein
MQREIEDPEAALAEIRDAYSGGPLAFGRKYEPALLARYELETGREIARPGLLIDRELDFIGASPDGVLPDRTIEGKCRVKIETHAATILRRAPDDSYIGQVQGQMMVAGVELADFVSYCPYLADFERKLVIVPVPLDPDLIDRLREESLRFWGFLQRGERLSASSLEITPGRFPSFFI